jgi:formate hydrogenlyase subunit 6/NADH:ubiquinone oxidoreductase subunit I
MKRPGKMVGEVLRASMLTPATIMYPFVKIEMPPRFRGKIAFTSANCIGCKLCMRDCPANAITINKVGEKQFEAVFNNDRCIFCAQCVDTCPRKALASTPEFELASLDRGKLKVVFHAAPGTSAQPVPSADKAQQRPA